MNNLELPENMKPVQSLIGHKEIINRIAYSPDGKKIATPAEDLKVNIWDAETGENIQFLVGQLRGINSVSWSADSKMVAAGSSDSTILVWDAESGKRLYTLKGPEFTEIGMYNAVSEIKWTHDDTFIVAAYHDTKVRVWDPYKKKIIGEYAGHDNWVLTTDVSPSNKMAASAGTQSTVDLWDIKTLENIMRLDLQDIFCVRFSPDEKILALTQSEAIVLYDIEKKSVSQIDFVEGPSHLAFHPTLDIMAAMSSDHTIKIWNTKTWQQVYSFKTKGSNTWPPGLAFHPVKSQIAVPDEEDTVIQIIDFEMK